MGLFDLFSKKKTEPPKASFRELQRYERLVGSKLSQNMDSQEAIHAVLPVEVEGGAAGVAGVAVAVTTNSSPTTVAP